MDFISASELGIQIVLGPIIEEQKTKQNKKHACKQFTVCLVNSKIHLTHVSPPFAPSVFYIDYQ